MRPFAIATTTLLFCVAGAYAGVSGTYVETYTFYNTTGATANDLGVFITYFEAAPLGGDGTVTSQSPFPAADNTVIPIPPNAVIAFGGATVNAGDSASFTITDPVTFSLYNPVLFDYRWSLEPTGFGPLELPLGIDLYSPTPFDPSAEAFIEDADTIDHNYTNLYINQNGGSLLAVPSSGTLTAANAGGEPITNPFNLDAGTVSFGLMDTTDDFTLAGTFTPTPEPATWGVCGFLLLTMGIATWRRRIVAR
jgi:hypothetical protein